MSPRIVILTMVALVGGCTTTAERESAAEQRGYERGYRQAVQEQYWIIQQQQRRGVPPTP